MSVACVSELWLDMGLQSAYCVKISGCSASAFSGWRSSPSESSAPALGAGCSESADGLAVGRLLSPLELGTFCRCWIAALACCGLLTGCTSPVVCRSWISPRLAGLLNSAAFVSMDLGWSIPASKVCTQFAVPVEQMPLEQLILGKLTVKRQLRKYNGIANGCASNSLLH